MQSEMQTRSNQIDEALKPRGFILRDPMADTALMASLALLTGGALGRATKGEKKEEQLANYEEPWYMKPGSPYIAY